MAALEILGVGGWNSEDSIKVSTLSVFQTTKSECFH